MEVINDMLDDLNMVRKFIPEKSEYCRQVFEDIMEKVKVDVDIYHSAKAFTSIVNNIINKKLDYIDYITKNQIELLTFLNTYDDKYLSNIENLLIEEAGNEILIINDLMQDIIDLLSFLQDFLTSIKDINQDHKQFNLQMELNRMLDGLEKKYEGGI